MEERDKILESHQDNDGIHEYDNPLPAWFLWLFYGCIAFSGIYAPYYAGYSLAMAKVGGVSASLAASGGDYLIARREEERTRANAPVVELHGKDLIGFMRAPASISGGDVVYKTNCVACHGDQGQGIVGPNLTDAYWIHGGAPEAILKSIEQGYADKGMPAWKNVLGAEKVRLAAAYVLSLKGRNVANPKAPQGEKEP